MKKALITIMATLIVLQAGLLFARDDEKPTLSQAPASRKSQPSHWYMVVCSSRADNVILQAGGSDNDNAIFATWHQKDGQKRFPLPESLQARTKIYARLSIPDGKWQTEACLGHDGYATKAFRFDRNNENHTVSMEDEDNSCACR